MRRKNQANTLTNIADLQGRPADCVPEDFAIENDANPERDKYAADKGKSQLTRKTVRRNQVPVKPPVLMKSK